MLGLNQAILTLAAAVDRLAQALAPETMAERAGTVAARIRVEPESAVQGGLLMQEYSINDAQKLTVSDFTPSVVSRGGNPFTKADGSALEPADLPVAWSTDNGTVAQLAFDPDGRNGKVGSGAPGRAIVTADIGPYPDGSTAKWQFGLTVGFSEPGDPTVAVVVEQE